MLIKMEDENRITEVKTSKEEQESHPFGAGQRLLKLLCKQFFNASFICKIM